MDVRVPDTAVPTSDGRGSRKRRAFGEGGRECPGVEFDDMDNHTALMADPEGNEFCVAATSA
ncbi:hypothetical protein [Streptomyces yanii]|uniref:hypothetical protein n=1 Tax=Streptomyces yanii TaxID=78510 RepID=UPI00337AEA48